MDQHSRAFYGRLGGCREKSDERCSQVMGKFAEQFLKADSEIYGVKNQDFREVLSVGGNRS